MAPKIYEIKVFRKGSPRPLGDPFLASVDLEQAEITSDTLNRHLTGAVERLGGNRRDQHLFHLEVFDIDNSGKSRGQALFRWVLPAAEVG
jgi:hypothetical protein